MDAVLHEDCITGMKRLEAGSVDLAFADPPFNIGYDYDVYQDRLESDRYLDWSRRWTAEVVRVLKPAGTFWLSIGDEYAADLKVMLQREHGLSCRNWVVWYYTFGVHCQSKFTRSHAHLFYMVKDPKAFTFNADADKLRVPSARQLVYADRRANPKGRLPDDTWILRNQNLPDNPWILRPQDLPDGFRPDEDTWYFPRVCGTFAERAGWHGCQMPEQLLGRIIKATSNEGELVLDPFAGSGTTLAVAKKLRRRFLGFELSAEYARLVEERLARIAPDDPLDGTAEPLQSAPPTSNGRRLDRLTAPHKPRKKGGIAPGSP
jgi:DNA modification methylase